MSMYAHLVEVGDWRRRELTQLKTLLLPADSLTFECLCRGAMVLCYSHWEGYFNDLTEKVFERADPRQLSRAGLGGGFQCLFLRSDIDRLASSRSSDDGVITFLQATEISRYGAESMNLEPVKSRSSLNWGRLCKVADVYGLSWISFERKRIFVDHKLCRIRHQIAHGDSPRLTLTLAIETVDETLALLDELVDYFSEVQVRLTDCTEMVIT